MEIFINEVSLQEQYFSDVEFTEVVRSFTAIFFLINERIKKPRMYKSALFFNYRAIRGEHFQASFKKIRNRQLKDAFRNIVFNKLNPRDWQLERKHRSDDIFEVGSEVVTDTSIAELAERKLQDAELCGLLVNFIRSSFADRAFVDVVKNEQAPIAVDCVDNQTAMREWLGFHLSLPPVYALNSKSPPRDEQTVLRDTTRFRITSRIVQGNKVYREQRTGYYWYVEHLHCGRGAHLEVFDAQGKHVGEASLEGEIDFSEMDSSKRLNLR